MYNNNASYNTALGSNALYTNTTGAQNTAVGYSALYNSTGDANTAIGTNALVQNTTGYNNTAAGALSLYTNAGGYYNTAFGHSALYANTSGTYNTAVGDLALSRNTTGTYNTNLGYNNYPSLVSITNYSSIGANAGGGASASNMVEIGNSSVTVIRGQVAWSTYSDERVKENVTENVPGLDFINKLRPVTYNYNIHKENEIMYAGKQIGDWDGKYDIEKIRMTGFIAQEVDRAAKATGYDFSGIVKPATDNDLYSLRYSEFVVPLVKAVQEQQKMIIELKKEIEILKAK